MTKKIKTIKEDVTVPDDASNIVLVRPAIESLFYMDRSSFWPEEVLSNPELVMQISNRRKLYLKLSKVFESVPDPSTEISDAVDQGLIEAKLTLEMYECLIEFLDSDTYNRRILLYLPFEFVPHKEWRSGHLELDITVRKFMHNYMICWKALFLQTDVRANFVDGNILEPQLTSNGQPLVRKAAHLIPFLVKKGYLTHSDVRVLKDTASSSVLRESIIDAIEGLPHYDGEYAIKGAVDIGLEWLKTLESDIEFELKKLDMRQALDTDRGMPLARVAWQRINNEEMLVDRFAFKLSAAITMYPSILMDVLRLLSISHRVANSIIVRGIGRAIESCADNNMVANEMAVLFIARLSLYRNLINEDELGSTIFRLFHLGLVSRADLESLGLKPPYLDTGFSDSSPLASELKEFRAVAELIAMTPELSRLFYPVLAFFGSRLKGYAKKDADLDVALFVRPGVPVADRSMVRQILVEIFSDDKVKGKVVEFWLKKVGENLVVQNLDSSDIYVADNTWVHLLLSSVWLGESREIEKLYSKLLPGFFHPSTEKFMGLPLRRVRLGEMEREVLQYRLMHKGYQRFFAPSGGIGSMAKRLDPNSMFWDSGYRRLSTKLFVSRVFFPVIKK